MFNDTFLLRDDSGKKIPIEETNIAWASDIQHRFQNMKEVPDGRRWKDVQWQDMTDGKYNYKYYIIILINFIVQSISSFG